MRAWLIFLAGLYSPTIDKEPIMRRAMKWIDNACWCWLASVSIRWAVIAFVAWIVGLVVWRSA